jgi:uncharacterized protein YndB with AHSA1/START domain
MAGRNVQLESCDSLLPMDEPVIVTREVELDGDVEDVWRLVGDGEGWEAWLAPSVDVDVQPGGQGTLVDDDGVLRHVQVGVVQPGERVGFTWWRDDDPAGASQVELLVVPRPAGTSLRIVETFASARLSEQGPGWDVPMLVLCVLVSSLVRR